MDLTKGKHTENKSFHFYIKSEVVIPEITSWETYNLYTSYFPNNYLGLYSEEEALKI